MKALSKNQKAVVYFKNGNIRPEVLRLVAKSNGNIIRPCQWKGFKNLLDDRDVFKKLILSLGYKFKTGNDAPKRGVEGEYIKISSTCLNTFHELLK